MPPDPILSRIVGALAEVPGVAAIALGGSRARGTAHKTSDYDIGLWSAMRFDGIVMHALVAGIHVLNARQKTKTWMAGTSPAMTSVWFYLKTSRSNSQPRSRQCAASSGN